MNGVHDNNKRNNNVDMVRDVPNGTITRLTRTLIYSLTSPQLDTSMVSPGVIGPSIGVVKRDADVDDGIDISTVPLVSSCVNFPRKSWLLS